MKNGLYAVNFGGGQVDITSGKYVFQCTEAYKIENGKIGAPVKGAMLIGNGPTDLHRISMIGNDMALDPGIGTCGKNGQGVPVGVGQPTLRMDQITVGGTALAQYGRIAGLRVSAWFRATNLAYSFLYNIALRDRGLSVATRRPRGRRRWHYSAETCSCCFRPGFSPEWCPTSRCATASRRNCVRCKRPATASPPRPFCARS